MAHPETKTITDVFTTVGLPQYTYIKPSYYGEIRVDIEQKGRHLLIEGPSGIGKTCVVYKVLEELEWSRTSDYLYLGCRDEGARDELFRHLNEPQQSDGVKVVIIDDFHLLSQQDRSVVGSLLKRISDKVFERQDHKKFVLIGIPAGGQSLLEGAQDLGPRIGIYRLKTASDGEIDKLIDQGEQALNILFQNRETLLGEASGNFWLAQHICSKICSANQVYATCADVTIISFDILDIRRRIMDELSTRFDPLAETFCKGKKWRPGGNKPYLETFVALTKTTELVISFDKVLSIVEESRRPGIKAIRPRIAEVIYNPAKHVDLRKYVHFDPQGSFSIEDPLFRYYLNHIDVKVIFTRLGIPQDAGPSHQKLFEYDIGFSFAGEARVLVATVNGMLKDEDVVTFYDFDQQAKLLAEDLDERFQSTYATSCCYYLVFVDEHYRAKVWTKFERDIMTSSGRRGHIIPVILDEGVNLPGISSSIGHIDLSPVWREIQANSMTVTDDNRNYIKNRCILPILEKLAT